MFVEREQPLPLVISFPLQFSDLTVLGEINLWLVIFSSFTLPLYCRSNHNFLKSDFLPWMRRMKQRYFEVFLCCVVDTDPLLCEDVAWVELGCPLHKVIKSNQQIPAEGSYYKARSLTKCPFTNFWPGFYRS